MWGRGDACRDGKMKEGSVGLGRCWQERRRAQGIWQLGMCSLSGWVNIILTILRSNTGYVNLYGSNAYSSPKPKPLKAIANLTTPISTARFNHDAQILAIASKEKKDALRMVRAIPSGSTSIILTSTSLQVHLPSQTVFANWPTSGTPLGHVTTVDFSPQSEYVAIGNSRGRVLLYHLKDYGVQW